jgi:hypothetical protein
MAQDPWHWWLTPTARTRGGVSNSSHLTVRPLSNLTCAVFIKLHVCEHALTLGLHGGLHTLAGISCATPINLAFHSSPISNMASSAKTDFFTSCGSGFDAVFTYLLPAGATIRFHTPSTYLHTNHSIRYDGSCPGDAQASCWYATSDMALQNTRTSNTVVYYIQSGFASADSALNVRWTITAASNALDDQIAYNECIINPASCTSLYALPARPPHRAACASP